MRVLALLLAAALSVEAFQVSQKTQMSNSLNAISRSNFITVAAFGLGSLVSPSISNAGSMAQENRKDPTEIWETGAPNAAAKTARSARYANARNQLNSNFAPIKSLSLERKSPVTRLDLNYPDFGGYKKTYPGLFGKEAPPAPAPAPAADAAPADAAPADAADAPAEGEK